MTYASSQERPTATRREFVIGALFCIPGAALFSSCSGRQSSAGDGGAAGTDKCTLYPRQTEGPFYIDGDRLRRDITEGKPGTPLTIVLEIVRASDCAPLSGVAVDIWQCDATGVYSGFPGQLGGLDTTGQTFLRGTQVADVGGRVRFETIYPGWYPGRTTHIHFKVRPSSTTEATSQMYLPEETTSAVYKAGAYAARGAKDTSNTADGVNRGVAPLATVTRTSAGYEAKLTWRSRCRVCDRALVVWSGSGLRQPSVSHGRSLHRARRVRRCSLSQGHEPSRKQLLELTSRNPIITLHFDVGAGRFNLVALGLE